MLPEKVHTYLLGALAGAPDLFDALLRGLTDAEADGRPDPNRFTIREALAHLADWEDVFRGRLLQTRDEAAPVLQGHDEGQWALDRDYAHSDWRQQARLYRERRRQMVDLLTALTPAQWDRVGSHTELGPIPLEGQAVLISAHDAYHLQQIAQWRSL